jgi:hypothetical protein
MALMNRDQKVNKLLERDGDDARSEALNDIDARARENRTWGTPDHRQARERAERAHDAKRNSYQALSDAQLDSALAARAPA